MIQSRYFRSLSANSDSDINHGAKDVEIVPLVICFFFITQIKVKSRCSLEDEKRTVAIVENILWPMADVLSAVNTRVHGRKTCQILTIQLW